jgi:hypothetical protein
VFKSDGCGKVLRPTGFNWSPASLMEVQQVRDTLLNEHPHTLQESPGSLSVTLPDVASTCLADVGMAKQHHLLQKYLLGWYCITSYTLLNCPNRTGSTWCRVQSARPLLGRASNSTSHVQLVHSRRLHSFPGAFAKLRDAAISFVMTVLQHGTRLPLDGFWRNLLSEIFFFKYLSRKFTFH